MITDLMMPGQDGSETIAQLREEFAQVKVLVISGSEEALGKGQSRPPLGADGTLAKPFSVTGLQRAVDGVIAGMGGDSGLAEP